MKGDKDYRKIIEEYLSGIYTPEGEKLFNEWYNSFDDTKASSHYSEKDKLRIKVEMQRVINSNIRQKFQFKASIFTRYSLKIAAVLVSLFIIKSLVFYIYQHINNVEYRTNFGQKVQVMLPDESVVTLNANSVIRYSKKWTNKVPREVWIEGEAFFNITKSPYKGNSKFIVHTENLNIEVLGTKFNVQNRRGDTKVVLNSGKVKLDFNGVVDDEVTMKPGEMVEFVGENKRYIKRLVDPIQYSSWLNNQIIFDNTELGEIGKVLEDIYGYEVEIEDDSLAKEKFKGKFPTNKLKTMILALEESFNLDIITGDNRIIINRKKINLPEE